MADDKEEKKHPGAENLTPWEPGQSGNPAGRPKGSFSVKTHLLRYLESGEMDFKDPFTNEKKKHTAAEIIALTLIKKAMKDQDYQSIKDIIDRVDGRAKDEVKVIADHTINIINYADMVPESVVPKPGRGLEETHQVVDTEPEEEALFEPPTVKAPRKKKRLTKPKGE